MFGNTNLETHSRQLLGQYSIAAVLPDPLVPTTATIRGLWLFKPSHITKLG
jgi:hypothetical protein